MADRDRGSTPPAVYQDLGRDSWPSHPGYGSRPEGGGYGRQDQGTGVSDPTYNLISILYHALQGAELYERYARDAEQAGDREAAQFCREMQREERQRADHAKRLLASRLRA